MKELVIQHVYAFLASNGYSMTAAVFSMECKLDQSLLQTTPPGDDLETIVTNYQAHKMSNAPQIIVPLIKRTRKKNWIITEPCTSSVTMPTPMNSFERKRSQEPSMDSNTVNRSLPPPKKLCPSPRKSGTPRKHNAKPLTGSCEPLQSSCEEAGPSNQDEMQLLGSNNSDVVDMELLQSVINDTQLPQQLANSINTALQSVSGMATGALCDPEATNDNLVDRILENTQSDLLELLGELLPRDNDNND